jgi:hypothetical protein
LKIGAFFKQDGKTYMTKLWEGELCDNLCEGCAFEGDIDGCDKAPKCSGSGLDDNEVIYVEVTKV